MPCTNCNHQPTSDEDSYDTVRKIGLCELCMSSSDWERYYSKKETTHPTAIQMSPHKAADLFKLNPATDTVVISEIMEAGNVLAGEIQRLKEWKEAVLGMVKRIPEYETGEWGGDKESWGYVFELIKWQTAEIKKLQTKYAETAKYASAGKTLLTTIAGMTEPEIRQGDPVNGYIRVYERQRAKIDQLQKQLRRLNNATATKCPKCGGYSLALAEGSTICHCKPKNEETQ